MTVTVVKLRIKIMQTNQDYFELSLNQWYLLMHMGETVYCSG